MDHMQLFVVLLVVMIELRVEKMDNTYYRLDLMAVHVMILIAD